MHPAIRNQAYKVELFAPLLYIIESVLQHLVLLERTVFDGNTYFCQVLIDNPSGAQIHVAHFGIAHLTFGQTYGQATGF